MAPSRGLYCRHTSRTLTRILVRYYTASLPRNSGHNRWSKIKHDKGKADAAKNRQRSIFAHEIATASKLYGADPTLNPRLSDLITKAKREGFAKASIEAAIARGQGRSANGANLESVTVEGILPNNIAVMVECETDSKQRTLQEVRLVIRKHGGSMTSTSYLFTKKGRVTFESKGGVGLEEALEAALDAGASDVEETDEGAVAVWVEPEQSRSVGESMASSLGLEVSTSEILWAPNEDTKVTLAGDDVVDSLTSFIDDLHEKETTVQSVALNVSQGDVDANTWEALQSRIAA